MAKSAIERLALEQRWEISWGARAWRWLLFRSGFAQCRYCTHLKADNLEKFRSTRSSLLLEEGRCELALPSVSGSNLGREELRKFHRCPGFTEVMYNFKGFAFDSARVNEIKRANKSNVELFLQWAGWIVAIVSLVLKYKR